MASSVNFAQNTYSGEVLEDLLTYTAQGNDTYKEGLIHIKSGIQFKYTIPSVQLGKVIQDSLRLSLPAMAASIKDKLTPLVRPIYAMALVSFGKQLPP